MLLTVAGANVRRICTQLVGLESEVHLGEDSSVIGDHPQSDTREKFWVLPPDGPLLGWSFPEAAALRLDVNSGLLHS